MGKALVMFAVSEEQLARVRMFNPGELVEVKGPGGKPYWVEAAQLESSTAWLPVERESVWALPPESLALTRGKEWHRDPAMRRAHREAVRESLEKFLNAKLAELNFHVRTGWWVLGDVRVRVTKCDKVPEKKMKATFSFLTKTRKVLEKKYGKDFGGGR